MNLIKNRENIVIQITDNLVNIIIGNKNKIYENHSIFLNPGVCVDGTILDTEFVIDELNEYLERYAQDVDDVSFILRGSDIITRNVEVPLLKDDALREAINFEFRQFIPEIDDYYTNFEIVEKINNKEKKAYKLLLVAATKEKIDPIVEIAEAIDKKLDVIDILSNSLARTLKNSIHVNNDESTAVFYLQSDNSTLSILEGNSLKFERNLPFGVKNIFNKVNEELAATLLDAGIESKGIAEGSNVKGLGASFENLLNSINNTVRYYNSERGNKPVSKFVVICADVLVDNIEKEIARYFEMPCILVTNPSDIGLKVKFDEDFNKYIATYGILLRDKKDKLLNLNPKAINKEIDHSNLDKTLVRLPIIIIIGLILISIPFFVMNTIISKDISNVQADVALYKEIIEKNTSLKSEINIKEKLISRIKGVEDSTVKTSQILTKVNTHVPEEIKFLNLSIADSGSINISGESSTYEAIPEFLANLQMSDDFSNATISYINPIEKQVSLGNSSEVVASNVSTRSTLPVAMVGTFNLWDNKTVASEAQATSTGKGDSTTNNTTDNTNGSSNSNNSSETNNSEGTSGTNNSGVNSSTVSNSTNTNAVTMYSFSISIEGVNNYGTEQ